MALTMLGGCGEDEPIADPPPTTTTPRATEPNATEPPATDVPGTSTTTVASPSDDEAEVRAVIDRYWDAWFDAAGNPPDPDNATLRELLTGDAAARIIGGLQEWLDAGSYLRIPEGSLYSRSVQDVTFESADLAIVLECIVDDTELVSAATGEVLDSELGTLHLRTALVKYDEGWRITTTTVQATEVGVTQCDD